MNLKKIPKIITRRYKWTCLEKPPRYLSKYKWRPKYIFYNKKNKMYIAIDMVFNQQLPIKIFDKEIFPALHKYKDLNVCLIAPSYNEYNYLKVFCKKNRIGLKIYNNIDINTIIPLSFEKLGGIYKKKIKKEGWLPKIILNDIQNIEHICFKDLLINLTKKLRKYNSNEKQFGLVCKYIDKMLQYHSDFIGDKIPFMKLSNFEHIFNERDHVFHSIRVFIIGCIIIDKFYDKFLNCFKDIFPGVRRINIEYIWLLTSLFHDIGKIKQKAYYIYLHNPQEENEELKEKIEEEMSKVWSDEEYNNALCIITELIKHCNTKCAEREPFTGFTAHSEIDPQISGVLSESYNKLKSHGIISCFDIAADLLKKIAASTSIRNKTFLLYHIFTGVMSIAFHDWHIWNELKDIKIFPLKFEDFPFASLLIYIDTWDDFGRDDRERISIDSIIFKGNKCITNITWYDKDEYLEEKAKYESYQANIRSKTVKLVIKISNEKEVI